MSEDFSITRHPDGTLTTTGKLHSVTFAGTDITDAVQSVELPPPDLTEAIRILEEFKAETEKTEWVHAPMKRATIAGIQAAIIRLRDRNAPAKP